MRRTALMYATLFALLGIAAAMGNASGILVVLASVGAAAESVRKLDMASDFGVCFSQFPAPKIGGAVCLHTWNHEDIDKVNALGPLSGFPNVQSYAPRFWLGSQTKTVQMCDDNKLISYNQNTTQLYPLPMKNREYSCNDSRNVVENRNGTEA